MIKQIKNKQELEKFLNNCEEEKIFAMVKFGAVWCGPCKILNQTLEQIDGKIDKFSIAEIDVDYCPELATEYEVYNIPTMLFFRGKDFERRLVGAMPKEQLTERIQQIKGGE